MKIKSTTLGIIILLVIFGGAYGSKLTGWWITESQKVPVKIASGEYQGAYDPNDIRGSYSFKDVSNAFGVPVEVLGEAFGLPEGTDLEGFKNKDLEGMYSSRVEAGKEIGNGSVKVFVGLYVGLPVDLDGDVYLLESAAKILESLDHLTEEQRVYIAENTISLDKLMDSNKGSEASDTSGTEAGKGNPSDNPDHVESDEIAMKGKTIIRELLDWGVTEEEIIGILGEMPNPLTNVRTYCQEHEMSFSEIKSAFQGVLDQNR